MITKDCPERPAAPRGPRGGWAAWAVLWIAGCTLYSDPAPPPRVEAVRPRNRQMAGAGPDERYANEGVGQRSRPTGMLSNTDENPSMGLQKRQGDNGLYGTDAVGKPLGPAVTVGGGNATTVPSALSAPELRGRPERVFRPSTHYYVDGLDTGPSLQPANRVGQLFAPGLPWQTSGG